MLRVGHHISDRSVIKSVTDLSNRSSKSLVRGFKITTYRTCYSVPVTDFASKSPSVISSRCAIESSLERINAWTSSLLS